MIDKSESVNWANVWWILGADYLTLEGFMGDFREKYPVDWLREENSMQRNSWEKQYPALKKILLMTYNAKKKVFHCYMWGKKFITPEVWEKIIASTKSCIHPSPTNVQWSCQPFRGWGKKRIWHLSKCHPSTKWLAHCHHVVLFKSNKVLHFKIEKTPMKDTEGMRNSMESSVSFLWTNESFSL